MTTYKQDVKELSRKEIWTRAVIKLTTQRDEQKILKTNAIRKLWNYSFNEILVYRNPKPDVKILQAWEDFTNTSYGEKKPQDLKIAFFCGPEPENDIDILIDLGVRVENIWAIEIDEENYNSALKTAKVKFPTLKIFNGDIADLMQITSFKFDIVYLDFTATLLTKKPASIHTINSIFENNSLADLGIMIINSALPNISDDSVDFLSSYFSSHSFLEESIYSGIDSDSHHVEGRMAHGYLTKRETEDGESSDDKIFEDIVRKNFSQAYSAFSSHYPFLFASYLAPMVKVANNGRLSKLFLEKNEKIIKASIEKLSTQNEYTSDDAENECDGISVEELIELLKKKPLIHEEKKSFYEIKNKEFISEDEENQEKEELYEGGELYEDPENYPFWNFIDNIKSKESTACKFWYSEFTKNKNNKTSYLKCSQLYDLLRNGSYIYKAILSPALSECISEVQKSLPDRNGGVFCDVPMPHLWVELAVNHLGNSYHINTDQHWRAKYKAKEREMYLDMFTFDNCRPLYDWLPMLQMYGNDLKFIERQIIIRSCMDLITKQSHYLSTGSYYGANLIDGYTDELFTFGNFSPRINLNKAEKNNF